MKTTIEGMSRLGTSYWVRTACGHDFQITKTELHERQLFIGKRILCPTCTAK